jgi:hemerythrin
MIQCGEQIVCEVGNPGAAAGFVPLSLGSTMLLGIPELDAEHQQLVDLANIIVAPENEVAPDILLVRIREFFTLYSRHMQHEVALATARGLPHTDDMRQQHEDAIAAFDMFIETCENVDKIFPWSPRSLRQIFQCFLAHALEADLKTFGSVALAANA